MEVAVTYPVPGQLATVAAALLPLTIATSETTLISFTDGNFLKKSQLTMFYDITLGSATSVNIRYYFSPDNGTTWFEVPLKTSSTGVLSDTPTVLNSTSPTQSSKIRTIEDIPQSGSNGFKVTGTAVGATATLNNLYVYGRDN